jgi:hypothetical protein
MPVIYVRKTGVALRHARSEFLSSRVRQLLNKAELCFRFAGTLGNQAEAERLETLVLGHCYLEEADRVAASDEQRYRAQNAIPNRARAVPAEELDAGFQDRPDGNSEPTPLLEPDLLEQLA